MGHHYDPELKSVLVYSRDTYSPLAAKIHLMLKDIKGGVFNLDAPRTELIESLIRAAESSSAESEVSNSDLLASTVLKAGEGQPLPIPDGLEGASVTKFLHTLLPELHTFPWTKLSQLLRGRPLMKVYQQLDTVLMEASRHPDLQTMWAIDISVT